MFFFFFLFRHHVRSSPHGRSALCSLSAREQPIFSTRAHVFQIDPTTKRNWIPASKHAVSVSFFYDANRNVYRIISVGGTKVRGRSWGEAVEPTEGARGQWLSRWDSQCVSGPGPHWAAASSGRPGMRAGGWVGVRPSYLFLTPLVWPTFLPRSRLLAGQPPNAATTDVRLHNNPLCHHRPTCYVKHVGTEMQTAEFM